MLISGYFIVQTSFCLEIGDIKANASGNLDCVNTFVTLNCNADGEGVSYTWTGPDGYVSTAQSPVTTRPGKYTVSVTNPVTNTTATADIVVKMDTSAPVGVVAEAHGILSCMNSIITLSGSSTTAGVVYGWEGNGNFSSAKQDPEITVPGIYRLTVTNPVNGCNSFANVTVQQNIKPPEDVNATVSGTLTCNMQKVTLTGMSSTKDVNYEWAGPDSTIQSKVYEVLTPGIYALYVTDPVNGCTSDASVTVERNIQPPADLEAAASDTLTCKNSEARLTASASTPGTIFDWSGPDGLTYTGQTLTTNAPGTYTLKAVNPENECSADKTVTVVRDTTPPEIIRVQSSGIITCKTGVATLSCTSPAKGVSYHWNGPYGYSSVSAAPEVTAEGNYTVVVTKTSNGCSATKSITVTENKSVPADVTAVSSGVISCETPVVKLTGESSSDSAIYAWTGPDGFSSDLKQPQVSLPGKYMLTVIDAISGCKSETSVTVDGEMCTKN
jgi:hypothetical protein